jgi:hypothetical protein
MGCTTRARYCHSLDQQGSKYNGNIITTTGIHSFIAFRRYCVVCGNSAPSKSIGAIFPTAYNNFVSLYHILVILAIFQTFHHYYICYGDL